MDRIETGRSVRARLAAAPGAQRVPVEAVDLFIFRDFLDTAECAALVALIDADRKPSRLFADNPDPGFRTSETCNLEPSAPAVRAIEERLTDLTGLPPELGE